MNINQRSRSPIQDARVRLLSSHRDVAMAAASNCTAGWPDPESWEVEAAQRGLWLNGDPAARARQDSLSQYEANLELGAVSYGGDSDLDSLNEAAAEQERQAWHQRDTARRLRRAARMRQEAASMLSEVGGMRQDAAVETVETEAFRYHSSPFGQAIVMKNGPSGRGDSDGGAVRVSPSMSEQVAAAAVKVVRRLSALSRALPRMGPAERTRAEAEIAASSAALQAAGVEVV